MDDIVSQCKQILSIKEPKQLWVPAAQLLQEFRVKHDLNQGG